MHTYTRLLRSLACNSSVQVAGLLSFNLFGGYCVPSLVTERRPGFMAVPHSYVNTIITAAQLVPTSYTACIVVLIPTPIDATDLLLGLRGPPHGRPCYLLRSFRASLSSSRASCTKMTGRIDGSSSNSLNRFPTAKVTCDVDVMLSAGTAAVAS